MKCAVLVFPGTSGDRDMIHALTSCGFTVESRRHDAETLDGFDLIVLPGGFSYGDYLGAGRIAAATPIAALLKQAAAAGTLILGIGNGFQILTEMDLLPGGFLQNESGKFVCEHAEMIVTNNQTTFTTAYAANERITLPIAHESGNFWADEEMLQKLKTGNQIVFTYADNPNGSVENIAGMVSESGNVLGMMGHPERALECLLGGADGGGLFASILNAGREAV